jgi:hypothetical protein
MSKHKFLPIFNRTIGQSLGGSEKTKSCVQDVADKSNEKRKLLVEVAESSVKHFLLKKIL